MLVLSEAGLAVSEFVLLEQVEGVDVDLDVQERVLNANDEVISAFHYFNTAI